MFVHAGIVSLFSRALHPYAFEIRPNGDEGCVLLVFERPAAAPARFEIARDDILDRSRLGRVLLEIREALAPSGYTEGPAAFEP